MQTYIMLVTLTDEKRRYFHQQEGEYVPPPPVPSLSKIKPICRWWLLGEEYDALNIFEATDSDTGMKFKVEMEASDRASRLRIMRAFTFEQMNAILDDTPKDNLTDTQSHEGSGKPGMQTYVQLVRMTDVGRRHAPFSLVVEGLGCFPNPKRPRVLWAGVTEDTGGLKALQRDVEKSLVPLGFEPENRAFHPHLTLGRSKRGIRSGDQRRLGEVLAAADVGELGKIQVQSFQLMRSDLHPDGAVYSSLGVFSLGLEQ